MIFALVYCIAGISGNAELYCKIGVPFVMGTTGGDRQRLFKTARCKCLCRNISPNGKTGCCIYCSHGNYGRAVSWSFFWLFSSGEAFRFEAQLKQITGGRGH